MKYGIKNIFIGEPLSLILSIFLVLGIIYLGIVFQKYLKKNYDLQFLTDHYFSPIFGTYIIIFFLYPLTLLGLSNTFLFRSISYILLILGILFFIKVIKNLSKKIKFNLKNETVLYISFFTLFLIAAAPITHADSISYHINSAAHILFIGNFNTEILPFEGKLAGSGEIIIALGLSLGLQQFGGLLQFSSLFSLIPIFKFKKSKKINFDYILIILFTPITLFLLSSPKPQLMSCMASLVVFACLFENFRKIKKNINIVNFLLISILLINFSVKFSFILSSIILGVILVYENIKIKNFKKFFILGIFLAIFILLPYFLFRILNFGTHLKYLFTSPLPLNIFGYDVFHDGMTTEKGWNFINLIFPENLGKISTIFGPSVLLIFFLNFKKFNFRDKIYFSSLLFFLILQYKFGSGWNRFYYEPYVWMIYLISIIGFNFKKLFKIFMKYFYLQNFILFFCCVYLVIQLFPGSLNKKFYENVMHNNAKDYSLINWANSHLRSNDKILSYSRSTLFYNNYSIFEDMSWFIDFNDNQSEKYSEFLKSKKINRLVYGGSKLELGIFKNCIGDQVAFKKDIGSKVGRNPFNRGESYNGWIYEFNYESLPGCILR